MPPGDTLVGIGLQALQEVGDNIRHHRRDLASNLRGAEHTFISLARHLGVKVAEEQLLDPEFVANIISAEYDTHIKGLAKGRKYMARDVDHVMGQI